MKVYGVYSGCIYEGGGVREMYVDKDKCIATCKKLVRKNQAGYKKMFYERDINHYNEYRWRKKQSKYNKWYWDNTVDCVYVQEFEIIE